MTKRRETGWYDMAYNEKSDFLEIALDYQPQECEAEKICEEILIKKDPATGNVVGVWVYEFSKNYTKLREILKEKGIRFPLRIAPDLTEGRLLK